MQCLLRRVIGKNQGVVEFNDSELAVDELVLGSSAEADVCLPGSEIEPRHARIRRRGAKVRIGAVTAAALQVNDQPCSNADLHPGDTITIGDNRLQVMEPPPGFDLGLLLEAAGRTEAASAWRYPKDRERSRFSITGLAWILSLAVLVPMLAIPLLGLVLDAETMHSLRQNPWLPSDKLWTTGPLAAAHRSPEPGDDCSACHQRPFQRVTRGQCRACHATITHHVPRDSKFYTEISQRWCTDCHKEHKQPQQLVRRDQGLCTDCHANPRIIDVTATGLRSITDFAAGHPQFRVSLLQPTRQNGKPSWQLRRVDLDQPLDLVEQSNLKFDHQVHLAPEGVEAPGGDRVLGCGDCHRQDAGGFAMLPVSMEGQCRECHPLAFDERSPERELPHGEVELVLASLQEYYSRQGLERSPEVARPGLRAAQRPGRRKRKARAETVLAWAEQEARKTAADVFERSVCDTCHEVTRLEDEAGKVTGWRVEPVRLVDVWMPWARFSHRAHGGQDCADCHDAANSEHSSDVLMPGIAVCRKCHGGADSSDKLESTCVDCHVFHNPALEALYEKRSRFPVDG